MKQNQEIKLIPVLELQPANYSKVERESPKKTTLEVPQEWMNYNQSCYNDSGLKNIKPIEKLSWLFKIESLSDDELKIILKNLIDGVAENFDSIKEILNDPIEYAPLIPGGYLFVVDNEIKSEPSCCCGLEDILEWKDSETVITGHADDDFVYILKENSQVNISIKKENFILSEKSYNEIVNAAEIEIEKFIDKSGELINELLKIENGKSFAKAMIYKWE